MLCCCRPRSRESVRVVLVDAGQLYVYAWVRARSVVRGSCGCTPAIPVVGGRPRARAHSMFRIKGGDASSPRAVQPFSVVSTTSTPQRHNDPRFSHTDSSLQCHYPALRTRVSSNRRDHGDCPPSRSHSHVLMPSATCKTLRYFSAFPHPVSCAGAVQSGPSHAPRPGTQTAWHDSRS